MASVSRIERVPTASSSSIGTLVGAGGGGRFSGLESRAGVMVEADTPEVVTETVFEEAPLAGW